MAIVYGAVTVTTSATQIFGPSPPRRGSFIRNNDSAISIFVGPDANVTTSNGLPLRAGEIMNISGMKENWRGAVYGISASGSVDVRFWDWTD